TVLTDAAINYDYKLPPQRFTFGARHGLTLGASPPRCRARPLSADAASGVCNVENAGVSTATSRHFGVEVADTPGLSCIFDIELPTDAAGADAAAAGCSRLPQAEPLRGGREAGALQSVAERGAHGEGAVDALHPQPTAGGAHRGGEGCRGRLASRLGTRVEEVEHRLAALLDVEAERAVYEHDECARLAPGAVRPRALTVVGNRRPQERGTVRVRRVGRPEGHRDERRLVATVGVERAQPVDSRGRRELGRAELLHEVPASHAPGLLEAREHLVDEREPALDPLGLHRAARHDAVALEQLLRERRRAG